MADVVSRCFSLRAFPFALPNGTPFDVKELSMTRLMKTLVLTAVCGGLVFKAALPAAAQTRGELQDQINALQAQMVALQAQVAALQNAMPACMTVASGAGSVDDVVFTGCNVHVRNGQGSTPSSNSVGNLIIGYNESGEGSPARGGSHNVVIGPEHSYSSYGGLVAGFRNTVSGVYASVSGGSDNTAGNYAASVSGGWYNEASGVFASVSGGRANEVSSNFGSVSGGFDNTASGVAASVSGGSGNEASGKSASVSGGFRNQAGGDFASSVSGGEGNAASGTYASVSGGHNRTASGQYDWRAGEPSQDP